MGMIKKILLTSAVEAVALSRLAPTLSPFQSLLGTFATLFFVQFSVWAVYAVFIYPLYLSPLLDIPEPKVCPTCKVDSPI